MANLCENIVYLNDEEVAKEFAKTFELHYNACDGVDSNGAIFVSFDTRWRPQDDTREWLKEHAKDFRLLAFEPGFMAAWDETYIDGKLDREVMFVDAGQIYDWAFENEFLDESEYLFVDGEWKWYEEVPENV